MNIGCGASHPGARGNDTRLTAFAMHRAPQPQTSRAAARNLSRRSHKPLAPQPQTARKTSQLSAELAALALLGFIR
jgi:hypothetical protein